MKYVFREDSILTIKGADKANPQKIGEELEKIATKAQGHLTPEAILESAKDRRNVLHRHFEWDDSVAATQYRLDQARSLVRSIHVESEDTESGYSRAFLSIKDKGGTSYRTITEVMQSADLQSKVLAAAERDLLAFEGRYRSLTDICDMVRAAREQVAARRGAGQDHRASA